MNKIKMCHLILSRSLIIIANIQLYTGLASYDAKHLFYPLMMFNMQIFMILVIAEIQYQKRSRTIIFDKQKLRDRKLPVISLTKFEALIKKGKQYVIYDNYVLDVSSFMHTHPGSPYTIKNNIGRDIGKYFNGSYHIEASASPYAHSYFAYEIA